MIRKSLDDQNNQFTSKVQWQRKDNTAFDLWLRIHEQLGGNTSNRTISYSRRLNPMSIHKEADNGIYIEPNVWMVYQF